MKLTLKNSLTLGFSRQPVNNSKNQPSSLFDHGDSYEEDLKLGFWRWPLNNLVFLSIYLGSISQPSNICVYIKSIWDLEVWGQTKLLILQHKPIFEEIVIKICCLEIL